MGTVKIICDWCDGMGVETRFGHPCRYCFEGYREITRAEHLTLCLAKRDAKRLAAYEIKRAHAEALAFAAKVAELV